MSATTESPRAEFFDKEIIDYSIDSRTVSEGQLFFALSQPDYERAGFNGIFADLYDFIGEALVNGAIAAVARRDRVVGDEKIQGFSHWFLLVDDVIARLQKLPGKIYDQ